MAREKTTLNPFNAVADSNRRQLIELLARGEYTVTEVVQELDWSQPQVSKHLSVLKQVNLVLERKEGRKRIYCLNSVALKPIHNWIMQFEQYWIGNLNSLGHYLNEIQKNED
ncbi:MAG: winged helix-turn-helix transcriptional regulator [Kangiellaceae bacterium]|nr:winged helix-turn-helix transcriptional regulator [Kangiellaceae bacterium]